MAFNPGNFRNPDTAFEPWAKVIYHLSEGIIRKDCSLSRSSCASSLLRSLRARSLRDGKIKTQLVCLALKHKDKRERVATRKK